MLSRGALARVLQSLLETELKGIRQRTQNPNANSTHGVWPEDLSIVGDGGHTLACDSLEVMSLSAAVNEMFHLYESRNETDLISAQTFGQWLDIIEGCWRSGVTKFTFATSGSTGKPKQCTHEFAHLHTEVGHLATLFGDRKRIIALVRAHHIYGFLFTAMLADHLAIEVIPTTVMSPSDLSRQLRIGDLIVSIPDSWQWIGKSLPRWPHDVEGVVSTGPCPAELIGSLMERGLARMTEIYGSSETAGIAIRVWPENHFHLMPQWQLVDHGESNQILHHSSGMEIRPMDNLLLFNEQSFTLGGRRDLAIQIGGTNVYPARIAAMLCDLSGVAQCIVRPMRPDEGSRLKAFIVPDSSRSTEDLKGEVESWSNANLIPSERPKAITFGPLLPRNASGEPCDW